MNNQIPLHRIILYTFLFSTFLLGGTVFYLYKQHHQWEKLQQHIEQTFLLTQKEIMRKKEDESLFSFYKKSNPFYLQQKLEPMILLQDEQVALQNMFYSPGFCGNKIWEERLHFLTSHANRMKLEEHPLYTSSQCKEVELKLSHSVEGSLSDLEKILETIEVNDPTKPLIQVTHFHVKRKKPVDQNEVFEMNFTFLKREFLET